MSREHEAKRFTRGSRQLRPGRIVSTTFSGRIQGLNATTNDCVSTSRYAAHHGPSTLSAKPRRRSNGASLWAAFASTVATRRRRSARLKLATAGVELGDVAFASAHDAASKMEIMSVALTRALEAAQLPSYASLTYVGDSAVDAQAAQALGFHFIGIDTSGWVSHVPHRFLDFSDHDAFIDRVLTLRETPA
jgi:hypothetical protein